MENSTALLRIRLPRDIIDRLDGLADMISTEFRRRVPRAALVRAMVLTNIDPADRGQGLAEALGADPVKRGRKKGAHLSR